MIAPQFIYRARVVSVYDGDTITADLDLGLWTWRMGEKLRLYGIDTPEVRGPEATEGKKVRDYVRAILPDGAECVIQTIRDRSGKYGRLLAIVWPKGWAESLNGHLLRRQMAQVEAYSDSEREDVLRRLL